MPCPLEPLPGFGPCGGRLSGGTAVAEPPATFLSPFRAATRQSNAVRPGAVEFRSPDPLGIQSKENVRMAPAITWRGRGSLCPLRWVCVGRLAHRWAENKPGSAWPRPLGIHPSTPSARGQRQCGGSADLCVRSAGCLSEGTRADGQRQTWIGLALRHFDARPYFAVRRPPSSNIPQAMS